MCRGGSSLGRNDSESLALVLRQLPDTYFRDSSPIKLGCLWLGPPWFNYWFSFTLAYSRISHEYSSLFIIVINLIFMFSL